MEASVTQGAASAIARLTERERECLRLWLEHKTAKEIALDLGISHHAVEKRLKMARTKLDVATSLEAARLLAEAEGYDRTVAGPAELPDGMGGRDDAARVALPSGTREWRRSSLSVPGAIIMSLLIAALAFAATQQISGNVGARTPANGEEITGQAEVGAIDADNGVVSELPEVRYGQIYNFEPSPVAWPETPVTPDHVMTASGLFNKSGITSSVQYDHISIV